VIFALNSENGANDLRGMTCIELKLAGMTEKKSRWRSIMLKNLGLKEEPKTFTGGQGFSCSSPLDHSAAEITVEENDAKPSTTVVLKEEADRIGHFMTDWEHSKMRMVKQNTLFCLIIPESLLWVTDAKALLGDRIDQADRRAESAKKSKNKRKRKEGKIYRLKKKRRKEEKETDS
jgi:hypothetical protein